MTEEIYVPHIGWLAHGPHDEVASYLNEGWFEYKEQAFLWLYLREGDVVADCGAHFGLYSLLAARAIGNKGAVLAIEPNPHTIPVLEKNLREHGAPCVSVVQSALSSRNGTAKFYLYDDAKAAYSSMIPDTVGAEEIEVETITLDSLCRKHNLDRVDFTKIDAEGLEIEILKGAAESMAGGRLRLLMIEFTELNLRRLNLESRDLFQAIESSGYRIYRFDEQQGQLIPESYNGPVWYENYFATREVEAVNKRLRESSAERKRIACELVRRGVRCYERYREASRRVEEAGKREAEANERAVNANARADWANQNNAALTAEWARRLDEAYQRGGEANWRTDEANYRAMEAWRRAEELYRELHKADTLLGQSAKSFQALELRLQEVLESRYLNLGWKLRLAQKPGWVAEFLENLDRSFGAVGSTQDFGDEMDKPLRHLATKHFDPKVVLDIGATNGYWSLRAGNYFTQAEFLMIEPQADHEGSLRSICEQYPRYRYILAAVGSERGGSDRQKSGTATTVDELLAEGKINQPQLVKIDAQGLELDILKGGRKMLESADVFIIEANLFSLIEERPCVHEIIAFMTAGGFSLVELAGSLRQPPGNGLGQVELVMVSSKSPLLAAGGRLNP